MSSAVNDKATISDNLQLEAAPLNTSSEDTDDNLPLPVGGHEDNPSDSGTTSDDEGDAVNPAEDPAEVSMLAY